MNNFDDLFEQQPQAEAAPQKQESQKERPKRQWWQIREEKQRKEAYATLDRIFGEFSEGTGSMEAYLDVQSRFPFHSARNALLIGDKCPDAVRVGGYKEWHAQGIEILEDEKRLPIIILEPGKAYRREDGSVGQNFYAKEVYDISQTTARDEAQPQVSYDDRLLLKGLIASSPVPIRAVEELPERHSRVTLERSDTGKRKPWHAPAWHQSHGTSPLWDALCWTWRDGDAPQNYAPILADRDMPVRDLALFVHKIAHTDRLETADKTAILSNLFESWRADDANGRPVWTDTTIGAMARTLMPGTDEPTRLAERLATDMSLSEWIWGIARDMPELDTHLHYRMVDVSSIKELCRRWYPRIYFGQPEKGLAHRALADIHESIDELAYYREHFLVK